MSRRGKDYRFIKSALGKLAGDGLLQSDDDKLERGVEYNFLVGIVNDVISNPYTYLRKKVDADKSITVGDILSGRKKAKDINIGIANKDLVDTAPVNSIIAQITDPGRSNKDGELPVLCYPFFPSHLSLPLKPGEYVWLIECDIKGSRMYYWMCRQVGPIQVDDLNYTHMERLVRTSRIKDDFIANSGALVPNSESLDEAVSLDGAEESTNASSSFSRIFANSNAYRTEFTGEPVPRLAKDCADLLLQGSNNSGIHLTTEKFSNPEDINFKNTKYTGKTSEDDAPPTRKPDSSAIDIFVKRKKNDLDKIVGLLDDTEQYDKINTVKNNCQNDFYTYLENDKLAALRYQDDSVYDKELIDDKSDAIDVGARVYLSHNCDVDNTFLINFDNLGKNAKVGPSIVTFAQHNRVIGDEDVRLVSRMGQSFIDLDEKGNIIAKASKDDGQQFLSLGVDGTSRLQAKNKIQLVVGSSNDVLLSEDYVLVSQLEALLTQISINLKLIGPAIDLAATSTAVPATLAAAKAGAALGNIAAQTAAAAIDSFVNGRLLRSSNIVGC